VVVLLTVGRGDVRPLADETYAVAVENPSLTRPPQPVVTVFVADDHPMYREGVARAVKGCDGLELIGQAGEGLTALEAIRRLEPGVAVIDLDMPGRDGLAIARALADAGCPTRVMILSGADSDEAIYESVSAGAVGYLAKDADRAEICDAIRAIARGEIVLGRRAQQGLAQALRSREQRGLVQLTPREREVLALIADGLSAPKIAERLHLSTPTVKTHLGTLYEKLGVSDRGAAVATGMRLGLLS
jgi:two-component system, NarL family, nitrate/nitrite response regulator NarL